MLKLGSEKEFKDFYNNTQNEVLGFIYIAEILQKYFKYFFYISIFFTLYLIFINYNIKIVVSLALLNINFYFRSLPPPAKISDKYNWFLNIERSFRIVYFFILLLMFQANFSHLYEIFLIIYFLGILYVYFFDKKLIFSETFSNIFSNIKSIGFSFVTSSLLFVNETSYIHFLTFFFANFLLWKLFHHRVIVSKNSGLNWFQLDCLFLLNFKDLKSIIEGLIVPNYQENLRALNFLLAQNNNIVFQKALMIFLIDRFEKKQTISKYIINIGTFIFSTLIALIIEDTIYIKWIKEEIIRIFKLTIDFF